MAKSFRRWRQHSVKSWCVSCDDLSAPVRVRHQQRRDVYRQTMADPVRKARFYARIKAHKQSLRGKANRRHREVVTQFTQRTFACTSCRGRFAKQREAWRRINGVRVALGMCAFCAEQHHGPSRHEPHVRRALQRASSASHGEWQPGCVTHFGETGGARTLSRQHTP